MNVFMFVTAVTPNGIIKVLCIEKIKKNRRKPAILVFNHETKYEILRNIKILSFNNS